MGEFFREFFDKVPTIIDSAGRGPVALASLIVLVLGIVGAYLFRNAAEKLKLAAFAMIIAGLLGLFILASNPKPPVIPPTTAPSGPTAAPSHVQKPGEQIEQTVPPVFGLPGAKTRSEMQMSADELGRFQRDLLCLPETATFDRLTREGITIFQQTRGATGQEAIGQIDATWRKELIRMNDRMEPCPNDAQNFFELTSFFVGGELQTGRVKDLQQKLNASSEGEKIEETGLLDPATRNKIAAIRQDMKDLGDAGSATQQVTPPFFRELKR